VERVLLMLQYDQEPPKLAAALAAEESSGDRDVAAALAAEESSGDRDVSVCGAEDILVALRRCGGRRKKFYWKRASRS
jgi:hypothetical protein